MEIIFGIIGFVSLLLIIIVIIRNKFLFSIIKIDKAEEDIDIYLEKKCDLLKRTRPIIKKELKIDEFLEDLNEFNVKEISNFTAHNILKSNYNELFKTLDDHEKLLKSDTLISILEELNENEEQIIGAIKFYNDTVVDYNQLVVSFPASILAFLFRYKKKEFYNNEKREMFEILNDK